MFLDIMLLYAWQKEIESKYIILLHSLIPCFLANLGNAHKGDHSYGIRHDRQSDRCRLFPLKTNFCIEMILKTEKKIKIKRKKEKSGSE